MSFYVGICSEESQKTIELREVRVMDGCQFYKKGKCTVTGQSVPERTEKIICTGIHYNCPTYRIGKQKEYEDFLRKRK
jgi:hypothetical protein